ncbi:hypothetical protein ACKVEX_14620 [Rhodocyclaceae bacterium SMB388]
MNATARDGLLTRLVAFGSEVASVYVTLLKVMVPALIVLLGADLSGILWTRLAFAFVVIATLARLPVLTRRLQEPDAQASR